MSKENDKELSDLHSSADAETASQRTKSGSGKLTAGKKNRMLFNILSAAAVICVMVGGLLWYKTRSGGDVYANIQESIVEDKEEPVKAPAEEPAAAATTSAEAATTAAPAVPAEEIPIDFKTLWETCPDAYAWIRIPNTQIDYPICQMVEGDQSFYLNHRADKVAEFAGSIYSENYNTRDFTDPVTVLYGHDMSNGSMFQNLHKFEDRAFFDQNKDVIVYLPDKVLHYRIFAAYNYNDDHLLLNHDSFKDENEFYFFLQDILAQTMSGYVDSNTELTRQSRILTLSTCNAYDDQRYLVQCLLMNPEAVMKTGAAENSSEAGTMEPAAAQ